MINFADLTIASAREGLDQKKFTTSELAQYYLNQIAEKNPEINAYLEVYEDVLSQAEAAQKLIDQNKAKALTGIPLVLKDNIMIRGRINSAGSKILEKYICPYTSTAAQKILDQQAVILGRANMDEFAMGSSTENSAYGVTKNPRDPKRVSGGSSGGSAAAVAMNGALAALGSDTGGSIRQPASLCGVVGLKPTYGSVSRHGLMAMASSLDVIGPITKTVADAEILFKVISGQDSLDSTSVSLEKKNLETLSVKKIGVPQNFLQKGIDEDVLQEFQANLTKFKKAGYEIVEIDLPNLDYSLAVYYILMPAEVSSNMARYDGIKFGSRLEGEDLISGYFSTRGHFLGSEVKRRIMLGTYVLSAGYADQYYKKAWQIRNLIKNDFEKVFEKVDLIAMPTTPSPAFKIGEKSKDPLKMYLEDIFTISANLAGLPAISIPAGSVIREEKTLPIGLQLIAPAQEEQKLFKIGKEFETIV